MDLEELAEWYAHATWTYARLSLWRRRPEKHQGHRTAAAFASRDEESRAAAALFLAIEEHLDDELFSRNGLDSPKKPRSIRLHAAISRQ